MKINKIEILINTKSTDIINFYSNLPGEVWPYTIDEPVLFKTETAPGRAIPFVLKNFKEVVVFVTDLDTGKRSFIGEV